MWFFYALLGAFGKSYSGLLRKQMAGTISASMYMWVSYSLVLLILTPFIFASWEPLLEVVTQSFWAMFGAAASMMLATLLNMEALKREELSYTAPLNAFVPVFTLLIAAVFLRENPPAAGALGILAIIIGAYIVNLKPERVHWYEPLAHLVGSRGAQLSLGVAFGYAVNSVLMKLISNQGYGEFTIMYALTLFGWVMLAYVPFTHHNELRLAYKSNKLILLAAAISSFASSFFHILAIAGTYASYAVSIRRFEMPLSVLLGWKYLRETNIRNKLIGCVFMIAGAVIMALA